MDGEIYGLGKFVAGGCRCRVEIVSQRGWDFVDHLWYLCFYGGISIAVVLKVACDVGEFLR